MLRKIIKRDSRGGVPVAATISSSHRCTRLWQNSAFRLIRQPSFQVSDAQAVCLIM